MHFWTSNQTIKVHHIIWTSPQDPEWEGKKIEEREKYNVHSSYKLRLSIVDIKTRLYDVRTNLQCGNDPHSDKDTLHASQWS